MPLYVDFIDYDQEWFTPQTDTRKLAFEPFLGSSELIESIEALTRLRLTSEAALYSSQCLRILNETFNPYSIGEETSTEQLSHLYEGVAQNVETEIGIPKEKFFESALNEWPLYAFVNLMYKKR
jgi:hypothetical protein